jgi:hypothetical protein
VGQLTLHKQVQQKHPEAQVQIVPGLQVGKE